MNAPFHPSALRQHLAAVEAKYPLRIVGVLPRGTAAHVEGENALDLLAEKRDGLDLLALCEAEADLADLLGRPVGIILKSGLKGRDAVEVLAAADPL